MYLTSNIPYFSSWRLDVGSGPVAEYCPDLSDEEVPRPNFCQSHDDL
jgi:hypothetical protein